MQHATRKVPELVHRDLKPANVLVDDRGRAMVTDFGLVCAAEAGEGTPAYMAPEQWLEGKLDQRTDIYAYGCIAYEMFTGHRMYAAATEGEWRAAHLNQAPVPLKLLNVELPAELEGFVFRCLEKYAEARPWNWDEIVEILALWFHRLTGQPAVLDFSAFDLTTDELLTASYSLGELGKYSGMLELCDRALAINPDLGEAWNNKGVALQELARCEKALVAYDRALAIDPTYADAWVNEGATLDHLGRHEGAIVAYDRALAINSNLTDP